MIAHIMLWDELTKSWPVQVVTNATTNNPSVFFCSELKNVTIWDIVKYISNSAMASTTTGGYWVEVQKNG